MFSTQVEAVQQSNLDSPSEYWVVCEGLDITDHNADIAVTICDNTKLYERVKGDTYATWLIMGNITRDCGEPRHAWGVFMLTARPTGWSLHGGTYYHSEVEALAGYRERGGV